MIKSTKSSKINRLRDSVLCCGLLFLATPHEALADAVWNNAGSTNWFTAGNWTPSGVPNSGTVVDINLGATGPIITAPGAASNVLEDGITSANGTLGISGGGTLTSTNSYLGVNTGSTGTATVDGSGSNWTSSGSLFVGNSGTGTLTIQNGGTVIADNSNIIGSNAGSTGTVTVTGSGSSWSSTNSLVVGNSGAGMLNIENGGQVSANTANNFFIGANSGSSGTVNITTGGGFVTGYSYLGLNTGSAGTITVTGAGSSWTNNDLAIGNGGSGSLTISDGGVVTTNGGASIANGNGNGAVTVTGTGSQWNLTGDMYVGTGGNSGNGSLTISNGGVVSMMGGNLFSGQGTGTDTILVDGKRSSLSTNSLFFVGLNGAASLAVQNGATVYDGGGAYIGNSTVGNAVVTGAGSTWTSDYYLTVGKGGGTGNLTVSNGGSAIVTTGYIGQDAGSVGNVVVTGSGSNFTNLTDLYIGDKTGSTGAVTVSNGGVLATASGVIYNNNGNIVSSSTIFVTDAVGATGTLNIGAPAGSAPVAPGTLIANKVAFGAGTGTLVFNHTSTGYDFAPAITGKGAIDLIAGSTIFTGDLSAFTGSINFDPTPGAIVGFTTPAAQQSTVNDLAAHQRATLIQNRSTANELLGMDRPFSGTSYAYAGGLFGSEEGYGGVQYASKGFTLLGGVAFGSQDYHDVRQSNAPTVALAGRYTFNDPFGDTQHNLHPFAETGGYVTPDQNLTFSRPYANGPLAAMGQGTTEATSWYGYGRVGMIWDATTDDQLAGWSELGDQGMNFGGYTEGLSQSNPFPATVSPGMLNFGVARLGASYTRDLESLIYAPWSFTLSGAAARSFGVHSGLNVTEQGLGTLFAPNSDDTWGEFGAQLNARLTNRITASLGLVGTTGANPIGTALHGTASVGYKF